MDVKRMEAQLRIWHAEINELTVLAEKAGVRSGFAYRQQIDDLKARCAVIQARLDRLNKPSP
jgi:hypothetical protein